MNAAAKLTLWRVLAIAIVAGATAATAAFGARYPQLAPANAVLAWLVGKLLGVPLDGVVTGAVGAMSPERAIGIAVGAVQSMPPAKAEAVAQGVLQDMAARAVGSPHQEAQAVTRSLLDLASPDDKQKMLKRIVFLASLPPPAAPKKEGDT